MSSIIRKLLGGSGKKPADASGKSVTFSGSPPAQSAPGVAPAPPAVPPAQTGLVPAMNALSVDGSAGSVQETPEQEIQRLRAALAAERAAREAENLLVRDCLANPDSRMFAAPTRPAWGDPFLPGDGQSSTKTSPKWLEIVGRDVADWPDDQFIVHLRSADERQTADGQSLMTLITNGRTGTEVAKWIKGKRPWNERIQTEPALEFAMAGVYDTIKTIMGNSQDAEDLDRYPVGHYLDTRVKKADLDMVVDVPQHYKAFFEEDAVIECRLRTVSESERVPYLFDDVNQVDATKLQRIVDAYARNVVEKKRDQVCPRPKLKGKSKKSKASNLARGGTLVEYMQSPAFSKAHNPVAQAATYAVLTRTKYFIICTGNVVTYGRVDVRDGKALVYLTRKFKWAEPEPRLGGWSPWEVLIRYVLAGMGTWYTNAFPDAFKLAFKAQIDKEVAKSEDRRKAKKSKGDDHVHDAGRKDDDEGEEDDDAGAHVAESERRRKLTSSSAGAASSASAGGATKSTTYALKRLYWEDLWAPLRFAVPATHHVEVECCQARLPGDAELLANGRMGATYRQPLQGRDVVVKTLPYSCRRAELDGQSDVDPYFLRDEMRHEERVYQRLAKLQGKVVPRLLWYGEIVEGMADALATEYAGEPLSKVPQVTPAMAQNALRALDALHAHGVLHGDLELRNFVVLGDDVKVIDFGFATLRDDYAEAEWEAKTAAERATLVEELDDATEEAPSAAEQHEPKHVDQPIAIAGVKRAFDAR